MKAWLLNDFSGIRDLKWEQAKDPVAGPGEVVLEVEYAALNPADYYLAEGEYPAKPPLPHILGRDGVGRVVSIGSGVSDLVLGDTRVILRSEVGVTRWGTFAERVAAPVESLTTAPDGWTTQQAAAAPLVYLTAWQALTQWGDLTPSVVAISGASGGVGVAGVQLAAAMGHTVIALSRSAAKRETLRGLGATVTLDSNDPNWVRAARAQLGGRRVDLAIDNIGGGLFNQLIDSLGNHGRISVVGRLAGRVPEFNTAGILFRRARIGGVAVGAYTPAESQQAWKKILATLPRTQASPLIDQIFPFEQLPQAFARLKEGPMGKVLLKVR